MWVKFICQIQRLIISKTLKSFSICETLLSRAKGMSHRGHLGRGDFELQFCSESLMAQNYGSALSDLHLQGPKITLLSQYIAFKYENKAKKNRRENLYNTESCNKNRVATNTGILALMLSLMTVLHLQKSFYFLSLPEITNLP